MILIVALANHTAISYRGRKRSKRQLTDLSRQLFMLSHIRS